VYRYQQEELRPTPQRCPAATDISDHQERMGREGTLESHFQGVSATAYLVSNEPDRDRTVSFLNS
jgi:hypothetical protein